MHKHTRKSLPPGGPWVLGLPLSRLPGPGRVEMAELLRLEADRGRPWALCSKSRNSGLQCSAASGSPATGGAGTSHFSRVAGGGTGRPELLVAGRETGRGRSGSRRGHHLSLFSLSDRAERQSGARQRKSAAAKGAGALVRVPIGTPRWASQQLPRRPGLHSTIQ